jgi:chemotaxis protein methyltransferase CheR
VCGQTSLVLRPISASCTCSRSVTMQAMSALRSTRPEHTAPAVPPDAEFSFGPADFERVRKLIYRKAGISLQAGKQAMVYSRLSRRLREVGCNSFAAYLQWLEGAQGPAADQEWQAFINCLTTNLTSFFREEHHFPVLAEALLARKGSSVRIWCNAASTGEEPYSLAMTVLEALGPRPDVRVVCSDIDTKVLATAARGVYPADARGLSAERQRRHFLRGTGSNSGFMRVKPELQQLLEFRAFNLMDAKWAFAERFDIVFCRNVMIYFDPPTQRAVLERMHGALAPHGLLFAGHSENFGSSKDLFELRGKSVYERV